MKLEIDPEFASLIPPLSEEEYMQLEANIVAEGCRDSLITWGSILIDGHNRHRICEKHGIAYQTVEREFADRDEAVVFIIQNQLGRRNLSAANSSILALKTEPLIAKKAAQKKDLTKLVGKGVQKKDMVPQISAEPLETRKELANLAGVSHDTISKVKRILEHGTPEQVERIKQGGTGNSISAVYREIRDAARSNIPTAPPEKMSPADTSPEPPVPPLSREEDLNQIRQYVADLKNPDVDRSLTPDMFLMEYRAFAEQFIRGLAAYEGDPYDALYPMLSDFQREHFLALSDDISQAVKRQNILFQKRP